MGIIRLLLALSVVATHCGSIWGSKLVGGQIAVQSFYIISGFYMSLILNEKYVGANSSYRLFITNRFIRLFPIYWTVLLATIVTSVGVLLLSHGANVPKLDNYFSVKANFLSFGYLILTNLLIFGQDIVMFLGISPESGNLFFTSNFWTTHPHLHTFLLVPQAWTLGLELTFYLVAPFILRKGMKLVVPLIVFSLLLRLYLFNYLGFRNDPWTYRFFPTEIMFFLLGFLAYRLHFRFKSLPAWVPIFALSVVVAFTLAYEQIPQTRIDYFPFTVKELAYFTLVVFSIPLLFNFFRKSKLDNRIGELSYPVYISHILVFMVCNGLPFLPLKAGWVVASMTIMVAFFLNRYIASPFEQFRQARVLAVPQVNARA